MRYYQHPTTNESIALLLGTGSPTFAPASDRTVVRGHQAWASVFELDSSPPAGTSIAVTWFEDHEHWVQVVYGGPGSGSPQASPLTEADVVAVAASFDPGAGPWPAARQAGSASGLPGLVEHDKQTLIQWKVDPVGGVTVSNDGRSLTLAVREVPSTTPTYCAPYAVPVLTAASASRVEVSVGLYVDVVPTLIHPCTSPLPLTRSATVPLDQPWRAGPWSTDPPGGP